MVAGKLLCTAGPSLCCGPPTDTLKDHFSFSKRESSQLQTHNITLKVWNARAWCSLTLSLCVHFVALRLRLWVAGWVGVRWVMCGVRVISRACWGWGGRCALGWFSQIAPPGRDSNKGLSAYLPFNHRPKTVFQQVLKIHIFSFYLISACCPFNQSPQITFGFLNKESISKLHQQ